MRKKVVGKVICIMGPTACGKTALAVEWAQKFPVDIVSVDSALVYRGMDIGTAKSDAQTLALAPHRLINILDPLQPYSAADFCRDAKHEIELIHAAGRVPLLVGGTMMYFRALQQGLSALPVSDPTIRLALQTQLQTDGLNKLYQTLQKIDLLSAERIKSTDTQRILRALEVFYISGQTLSSLQQGGTPPEYEFINLAIIPADRSALHQKIIQRFQQMLQQGFVEEVTTLKNRGDLHLNLPSMRAVGYRQIWEYLSGDFMYEMMVNKSIAATRQLAKRQITWLRSWSNCHIISTTDSLNTANFLAGIFKNADT